MAAAAESSAGDGSGRSSDGDLPAVKLLSKRDARSGAAGIMLKRQEEADRTVFVGNLDGGVKEEILYELFLQAGPLTKVNIAKDKEGNLKSFGFVCFKHTESVPYAISLLNGIRLFGRPIKLQYLFGSSYLGDPSSVFQGPENGFGANQADFGMPVMGEAFPPGFPMPCVDSSHLPEAYCSFQGMMNQFLAFQHPPYCVAAQGQPFWTMNPWSKEALTPYDERTENCSAGPSSQRPNLTVICDHKFKSRPSKRRREAESSDSDGDNPEPEKSKSGQKVKKRKKSKRRKL